MHWSLPRLSGGRRRLTRVCRPTCIGSVFGRLGPDHDAVMRIGGEAPGGGPILSVGIGAMFEYGFPPPRIVNSAVRRKANASAEYVRGCSSRPFSLPDAG